jgi:hypothetical protein
MSSPNANGNTSPQSGDAAQGADEKPRLTEEEKKQNHIASGTMTPDLSPHACSHVMSSDADRQ